MRTIIANFQGDYEEEFFVSERAESLTPELAKHMAKCLEDNAGTPIKIEEINFFYCEPIKVSTKIIIE